MCTCMCVCHICLCVYACMQRCFIRMRNARRCTQVSADASDACESERCGCTDKEEEEEEKEGKRERAGKQGNAILVTCRKMSTTCRYTRRCSPIIPPDVSKRTVVVVVVKERDKKKLPAVRYAITWRGENYSSCFFFYSSFFPLAAFFFFFKYHAFVYVLSFQIRISSILLLISAFNFAQMYA